MPLFSIIIPVYKVEEYLPKCITSVLSQSFKDFEIILVDDGSPDNCPLICDEFAAKDARIKVIHKQNGGISEARNVGINASSGNYLIFMDSDDYWNGENCFDGIISSINNFSSDVILFGCIDYDVETKMSTMSRGSYDIQAVQKSKFSAIKSLIDSNQFPASVWIMVVKRDLIIEHLILFENGKRGEDFDWIYNVFYRAESFDAVNDPFYIYFKNRSNSLTSQKNLNIAKDLIFVVAKWRKIFENDKSIWTNYLLSNVAYVFITTITYYDGLNKKEKNILLPLLNSEIKVLKHSRDIRVKTIYILYNLVGIKGISFLICQIRRIKFKFS